jgi:hypothetical protein
MDSDEKSEDEKIGRISRFVLTVDDKTLLQVNTSVTLGVLFFLTLFSFSDITSEEEGRAYFVFFTLLIVVPFGVSSMIIVHSNISRQHSLTPPNKDSYHQKVEDSYSKSWRRLRVAGYFTFFGFLYLMLVLTLVFADTLDDIYNKSTKEECAEHPEQFGVNETNLWQCSMFEEGSLAEQCVKDPERFNLNTTECLRFITSPYTADND